MSHSVERELAGRTLRLEMGKIAKQAGGSVWLYQGDTIVMASATMSQEPRPGTDFFPLTCDYEERKYAVGKIPGGFIKRGGRPSEKATLTSRLMDRPIRPLFPKGFRNEIQVINLVISADNENDPDVLAMIGTSAALSLSGIPFEGPVGAVRVALVDGNLVANPTYAQQSAATLEIVMAGTEDAVLMVEAGGQEIAEDQMLEALAFGHEQCRQLARIPDSWARVVVRAVLNTEATRRHVVFGRIFGMREVAS